MTAGRTSRPSFIARALDFVTDWGVLAYAVWTLIAWAGMLTEARVSLLVPIWLASTVPVAAGLFLLRRRAETAAPLERTVTSAPARLTPRRRRYLLAVGVGAGLVSAVVAADATRSTWPLAWAGGFLAVAVAVGLGRLRSEEPRTPRPAPPGWPADVAVVLVGVVFAAMSLLINRPNADDVFYVNRATATAQLDRIPVRDVLFTNEQVPPTSAAGLPVDTFSALQGAVARFLGVHAASVAYYITPPLLTFLAVWALWRLLRSWAPRRTVLCFALGCTYWLLSAETLLTPGSYFLSRMWQGKVIFVAWLVPVLYVYLTRWLARSEALTAVLLLAAAVSSIGMTSSAAFVVPLLFGTAALPLLVRRRWRKLALVVGAASVPFLVGLVVTQKYPLADVFGGAKAPSWYFHSVFGSGVLAAVGALALWTAPWLARRGPAASLTCGVALVVVLLLAPAVIPTLSDMTDISSALRRTLWIVPLPALVGLLAAVPLAHLVRRLVPRPALRRVAAVTPLLVVAGLLVAFGHPLWTALHSSNSLWKTEPAWKVSQRAHADAAAILARYQGDGAILADAPTMGAIAIITVRPKAVNPRGWYAFLTPEPAQRTLDRVELTDFVMGRGDLPRPELRRALQGLGVGLVCVRRSRPLVVREVDMTGRYREAFDVRGLACLRRE